MAAKRALTTIKEMKYIMKRGEYDPAFYCKHKHIEHPGLFDLWKNLSYWVAGPVMVLMTVNTFWEPEDHSPPEFRPYEHLRCRYMPFPWGDGNHSLLHNPQTTALPDGFEEEYHH